MTVNKKLSRMVEAHEIALEKIRKTIHEFHPSACNGRLTMATYSTLSEEYAFSFWYDTHYGQLNEVVRVKEGELK